MSRTSFREYSIFCYLEGYGWTGHVWAFLFFRILVLGLTGWASSRAVVEGYGCGTDPTALLG